MVNYNNIEDYEKNKKEYSNYELFVVPVIIGITVIALFIMRII